MAKKNFRGVLDDLIRESGKDRSQEGLHKIVSLGIPLEKVDDDLVELRLDEVVVFRGVDALIHNLMDQVRESTFVGQTDVIGQVSVEKENSPELCQFGIEKILFYASFEAMEELPVLHKQVRKHIRYIFNALQSPVTYRGFFTPSKEEGPPALLFPFGRDAEEDTSDLQYLVEKVPASHFIRITLEKTSTSRLNYRRINHRVISHLHLGNIPLNHGSNATLIHSSVLNQCRNNKISLKDAGLELSGLLNELKTSAYPDIRELAINWTRLVSAELMHPGKKDWKGLVERMLMILGDKTTAKLLNEGRSIRVLYGEARAYLKLRQLGRSLQLDLGESLKTASLYAYLDTMPILKQNVKAERLDLGDYHILFIHHLTNETLATLGAFEKMKAGRVDTLWVKYFGSIPTGYMNTIMELPQSVFRFFGLTPVQQTDYPISGYMVSDAFTPLDGFDQLVEHLESHPREYMESMQLLAMHLFLDAVAEAGDSRKVIIAEDGGYLAPLVNRLALGKRTLQEVCEQWHYPADRIPARDRKGLFAQWISKACPGTVEHTRNGYDSLMEVEKEFGQMALPACSLAISNYKVWDESIEVAYSCIGAMENMLNGQGFVFNYRKCLVLGSLGAIGIQAMRSLAFRLGNDHLIGIDIVEPAEKCPWRQYKHPAELPADARYETDLIFGVVGRSILDADFFEDLVLHTRCRQIFLASGSTKQVEFMDFLSWSQELLKSDDPRIGDHPLDIAAEVFDDPQTSSILGTRLKLRLDLPQGEKHLDFYLLSQLLPVNFQYYGVARETMDRVMTEFFSLVKVVSKQQEPGLPPRVLALDHQIDIRGNLL